MRCTPMAVWASSLKDHAQVYGAIYEDASFTHSDPMVYEAEWLYASAIQYLLNNPTDPNRGQNAFDLALKLSQSALGNSHKNLEDYNESCYQWLLKSQSIKEIKEQ